MSEQYQERVNDFVDRTIKWTSELESHLIRGSKLTFSEEGIRKSLYRPYTKKAFYYSRIIVHRPYQMPQIFPMQEPEKGNVAIYCTNAGTQSPFMLIATNQVPDSHLVGTTAKCLSLYSYDDNGNRIDNITDWGLTQFQTHYSDLTITKEAIFHYTYAVLHHPAYRSKYELNLKREFPRLPFYADFHQWATWGKALTE
jgi:predicted helicase